MLVAKYAINVFQVFRSLNLGLSSSGKIKPRDMYHWIQNLPTNSTNQSRSIYVASSSNRYYSSCHLVGVKNPRYLIHVFAGKGRRSIGVILWLERSKVGAFSFNLHQQCLFILYYLFANIITKVFEWFSGWVYVW